MTSAPRWRLRQVALVARDLDPVEAQLTDLLGVGVCFRDPGVGVFGLRNALWPVGDTFLEVVSPVADGTTAGRYLDKRGGDAGYMVILQTDDLDSARERLGDLGVRIVYEAIGEGIVGLHLHPSDTAGALLSLDRPDDPAAWPWAGDLWAGADGAADEIVEVTVASTDAEACVARWADLLGLARPDGRRLDLDRGRIVVVDGEVDGVVGLAVRAVDRERAGDADEVCGVTLTFV